MKWDQNYNSSEIEDRRSQGPTGGDGGGGGLGSFAILSLFSRFGWKGTLLGLLIVGGLSLSHVFTGGGGTSDTGPTQQSQTGAPRQHAGGATVGPGGGTGEDSRVHFVGFVFDDVQKTWRTQIPGYKDSILVLFRGSTRSACGTANTQSGPFYCPGDKKVYLDLAFYDELTRRFGSPGDFAQAYVIAHEVGHHIQDMKGLLGHNGASSVGVELQADCLAGAWGKDADSRGLIEAGDVAQALHAASAIGDDAIQKQAGGTVRPETFTHGSSAQRSAAFQEGLSGGLDACLNNPPH